MEIVGYIAAILIGISLGLIGGGGSILTVPVLAYLFGINATLATSYSLFIVGSTSLVGAYRNYLKGQVNIRTALLFGVSSITTVFLTRRFVVPAIPAHIGTIGTFDITKQMLTLVLFAVLMLLASYSMIKNAPPKAEGAVPASEASKTARLLLLGVGIGIVTGLLGAGGGFLLIPTLVLLQRMPMKEAVGTSLFIIALNSLIGFLGDLGQFQMDWRFLGIITSIAIAGILIGSWLSKKIPGAQLKKGFGIFVLAMGIYILLKELVFTH